MNTPSSRRSLEERLQNVAQEFAFPPTPPITLQPPREIPALRRGLIWALVLVLALNALLAVPQVRATIREWLHIGTVRIEIVQSPLPTPMMPLVVQTLGKPLTLAELRATVAFTVPDVPRLGAPDYAILPSMDQHVAVLLWRDAASHEPNAVLYILDDQAWAGKTMFRDDVIRTKINGQPAIWLTGDHDVRFYNLETGQEYSTQARVVAANVLIWTDEQHTYRLEMNASLDTMKAVAETRR